MASVFTMHEAKTQLSKLIARVEKGEELVIARGRDPVARIIPIERAQSKRRPGTRKTDIPFDMAFFDSLPEEHLQAWEGRDD